ncbi:S8 family serine peptidase [Neogemmobacter tilapiae]|uniref:P/Homo B domain-containing protein n=1 Tax=Neogemmobacter tilapiae TaxID=875041 RepID=A0A918WHC0_9RHOB|nr:S8 family serine peptidase [Gemmobacter tilapiae]GHC47700.1 hypothetical protein GCM10007315_06950 [Gemmobacter tilapiae]
MRVPQSHWWLLDGQGGTGLAGAWLLSRGIGIRVGMIDGGVWSSNPDLTTQKLTASPGDDHGTQVAGLIVGSDANAFGGIGGAPAAELQVTALDFDQPLTIADLAQVLAQQSAVDVSNNSWGFVAALADSFTGAGVALSEALDQALMQGRGGLGTVFVFAAGNGTGDVGLHNLTGGRRSIAVGASDQDGKIAPFSASGANLFLTAPGQWLLTSDGPDGHAQVSGTSFAAPLVSSAIALMLAVNPNLDFRDVQNILALTARPGEGAANAAGLIHSAQMGFGLLDAEAAVRLARHWTGGQSLANQEQFAGLPIDSGFHVRSGMHLEWVEIDLHIKGEDLRELRVFLISPSGHESLLLNGAPGLTEFDHLFSAAGFRGEDSGGLWRIRVEGAADVTVGALTLFGQVDSPNDVTVLTDRFAARVQAEPKHRMIVDSDGGRDMLNMAAAKGGAQVDLHLGRGKLGSVTFGLSGYEDLIGTADADRLAGDSRQNRLIGDDGRDWLSGRGGADRLEGGGGRDILIGGQGADVFVLTDGGADRLVDFDPKEDRLALPRGLLWSLNEQTGRLWLSDGHERWLAAFLPVQTHLSGDSILWL